MSRAPNQFNSYNQAGAYPLGYSAEGTGQAVAAFFNAVYAWMSRASRSPALSPTMSRPIPPFSANWAAEAFWFYSLPNSFWSA